MMRDHIHICTSQILVLAFVARASETARGCLGRKICISRWIASGESTCSKYVSAFIEQVKTAASNAASENRIPLLSIGYLPLYGYILHVIFLRWSRTHRRCGRYFRANSWSWNVPHPPYYVGLTHATCTIKKNMEIDQSVSALNETRCDTRGSLGWTVLLEREGA
eukprot:6176432-Pleurochrysis_carterae.AAC.8